MGGSEPASTVNGAAARAAGKAVACGLRSLFVASRRSIPRRARRQCQNLDRDYGATVPAATSA
jgi:hypothetical protein